NPPAHLYQEYRELGITLPVLFMMGEVHRSAEESELCNECQNKNDCYSVIDRSFLSQLDLQSLKYDVTSDFYIERFHSDEIIVDLYDYLITKKTTSQTFTDILYNIFDMDRVEVVPFFKSFDKYKNDPKSFLVDLVNRKYDNRLTVRPPWEALYR